MLRSHCVQDNGALIGIPEHSSEPPNNQRMCGPRGCSDSRHANWRVSEHAPRWPDRTHPTSGRRVNPTGLGGLTCRIHFAHWWPSSACSPSCWSPPRSPGPGSARARHRGFRSRSGSVTPTFPPRSRFATATATIRIPPIPIRTPATPTRCAMRATASPAHPASAGSPSCRRVVSSVPARPVIPTAPIRASSTCHRPPPVRVHAQASTSPSPSSTPPSGCGSSSRRWVATWNFLARGRSARSTSPSTC